MPHDRSREPIQRSGVTAISVAVDRDRALPRAALGEPLRVQDLPQRPGAHHVRRLLDGREQAAPVDVHGDALGLLEDDPDLLQRLGDLDPEARRRAG